MDREAKQHAISLAEELNLKLRDVTVRAVPEFFELARDPKTVFRVITDTQRLNFSLDYVFLDERERWLHEERSRLDKKAKELRAAIQEEIAECQREKKRLLMAIRYSTIQEQLQATENEQVASAPTSMITPSKKIS